MQDEPKSYLRLYAGISVAVVVVLLLGGISWTSTASPTPIAPPVVRVMAIAWTGIGCTLENVTGPGLVTAGSADFDANATIENLAPASNCTIESVTTVGGFTVVSDSAPILLAPYGTPGDTAAVRATIAAPEGWTTATLELTLVGRGGA